MLQLHPRRRDTLTLHDPVHQELIPAFLISSRLLLPIQHELPSDEGVRRRLVPLHRLPPPLNLIKQPIPPRRLNLILHKPTPSPHPPHRLPSLGPPISSPIIRNHDLPRRREADAIIEALLFRAGEAGVEGERGGWAGEGKSCWEGGGGGGTGELVVPGVL